MSIRAREAASARIRALVMNLPEVTATRAMLAFASTGTEVDLDPLLRGQIEAGVQVLIPWVEGPVLLLAAVRDLDDELAPGFRGVREPRPGARRAVTPERVDVALVPGVGFDRHGHRLGYGGGHFDRLLATLRPGTPLIGVAYACQVVEEIPVEGHDVAVDALVTETGLVRTGSG